MIKLSIFKEYIINLFKNKIDTKDKRGWIKIDGKKYRGDNLVITENEVFIDGVKVS